MTTAEAIKQADAWVRMNHYATNQYMVTEYSPKHRAWWDGQITNRESALRSRFESRIAVALELLGYDNQSANMAANGYSYNAYPCDWRKCVRDEMKADKLAHSQEEQPA